MTLLGVLSDLHLGDQKVTWKKLVEKLVFGLPNSFVGDFLAQTCPNNKDFCGRKT